MRDQDAMAVIVVLGLITFISISSRVRLTCRDTERELQSANNALMKMKTEGQTFARDLRVFKTLLTVKMAESNHSDTDVETEHLTRPSEADRLNVPSLEHEVMRRNIENNAKEFWYFIRKQLQTINTTTKDKNTAQDIKRVLRIGEGYQRTILNDLGSLANTVDNLQVWREKESKDLGNLVQQRLHFLQNPKNCNTSRKIVCNFRKKCGFGCHLHHATYCFITAYATQRTLILASKGWRYSPDGWETVFQPISETCTTVTGPVVRSGSPASKQDAQVVELPISDRLRRTPDYFPLAIPDDIGDRLIRLHGDPSVWWIGQFVTYLTRPQPSLRNDMEQTKKTLGFDNPIVGIHIRRTDKVNDEAAFHGVEEYMTYVEEWFNRYEQKHPGVKRKVYLATDDAGVLNEAKKGYPNYQFISDTQISRTAGVKHRYNLSSLRGVLQDIHFLSLCDYLVCTFSSQVCRVAYELMQPMHGDASRRFKSLDDVYYFGGQNDHNVEVVESHEPETAHEIDLKVNDLVGIAGNHWDGFSKGRNHRTGKTGLYPSYKVRDKSVRVKMPVYPEAGDR